MEEVGCAFRPGLGVRQAALELTDDLLEELELDLNREKTVVTSFNQGFKFLGTVFVGDEVYLPYPKKRDEDAPRPKLPPPLNLRRYLELKHAVVALPPEWRR